MIYTPEEALKMIRKLIEAGRRKGQTTTLIIKDDTRKIRVGEQKVAWR